MPLTVAKSLMLVRNTPTRTTSSKFLPAASRTAARFTENALGLGHHAALDEFAGCGILSDLAAEEDISVRADRLRKRADRRGEFGGNNCGFRLGGHDMGHGKTPEIEAPQRVLVKLGVRATFYKFIIFNI